MPRLFEKRFEHGEQAFYPNVLIGSAGTILHAHKFPHVALFYPGEPGDEIEYEIFAIRSTGEEDRLSLDAWSLVYIEAGVDHRIRLTKGKCGRFLCMFSRVGADGKLRADPKEGVEE